MKANSHIYIKSLLALFILLVVVLLFPPYAIKKNYKTFDFVFNSEYFVKKLDKTYTYDINSLERSLTTRDTIDAIDVSSTIIVDTIYKFTLKKMPRQKYKGRLQERLVRYKFEDDPNNYNKKIDIIRDYTITEIKKPTYIKGYRQLIVSQLIIEILISVLICGIFFLVLNMKSSRVK